LIKCSGSNDKIGFALLERRLTINDCIKSVNTISAIQAFGDESVLRTVVYIITMNASYFNLSGNITPEQALQIASLFLSEYKQESIEDLMMMFKKMKLGTYGKIFRLDGDVIFKAFNQYLGEKYEVFEAIKKNEKEELSKQTTNDYIEFAAQVLQAKEEKKKADKKAETPDFLTEKGHFNMFVKLLKTCSDKDLQEFLKYYNSKNVPVQSVIEYMQPITKGHLDNYIEAIKTEINNRKTVTNP
jgi:hypothetical protein